MAGALQSPARMKKTHRSLRLDALTVRRLTEHRAALVNGGRAPLPDTLALTCGGIPTNDFDCSFSAPCP